MQAPNENAAVVSFGINNRQAACVMRWHEFVCHIAGILLIEMPRQYE